MKITITIIIAAALAAVGYYGFTIYKDKAYSEKDVNAISNAKMEELAAVFLKTVSDKDIDSVYTMVTEGFKINVSRAELPRFIAVSFGEKKFKGLRSIGFSYSKRDTETGQKGVYRKEWIYEYAGIITFTDDSERKTHVLLVKDGGEWKVHYFDIAKKDIPPGSSDNSEKNIKAISNVEVERVVTTFLKTISKTDIDGAYTMTIEKFETIMPRDEFSRFITEAFGEKKFRGLRNNGFSYSKRYFTEQGGRIERWVYIYSGIMKFSNDSQREFDIALSREGGQWKVQHIEVSVDEINQEIPIR